MEIRRCMNCMEELPENNETCTACGADNRRIEQPNYALRCGTMLHERYLMGRVLGQGGFGITYIGMDMLLNIKVAIKEYFPMGMVTRDSGGSSKILWNTSQASQTQRQSGYESFLKEARKMAKIDQIPSIVRVRDLFLENETAYIVMDFVEGITLKQKLQQAGPISFSECLALLRPMMEDLAKVHRQGMIHRDISPDNIMIRKDGKVLLLDLGAAKDMTAVQGVSSQVVAKKGFSPFEQYMDTGNIGTWTDVYALCATIYYCITGKLLPEALKRIEEEEEISFPDSLKEPLSKEIKEALRAGLEVRAKKRTQSVEELLRQLDAGKTAEEAVEGTWQEGEEEGGERQKQEGTSVPRQEARERKEVIVDSGRNEKVGQVSAGKESSPAKTPKIKKGVWAALAVCLVVVGVIIVTLSGVEPKELPVMMEDANEGDEELENYTVLGSELKRKEIRAITFLSTLKNQPEDAWDVSEKQDGTVMAWVSPAENDMYELYIGGEGGVQAPKSCDVLFRSYTNVEEINFNRCFDTSQVTDMRGMFSGCRDLRELDVSKFDTGEVRNMEGMFSHCRDLRELDVSKFDTGKVTGMRGMFWECGNLTELDVSKFDTGEVMDMVGMFRECKSLKELDVRQFDTSQVTDMGTMFQECENLGQLDVRQFDTSQVTNMASMFNGCRKLRQLDVRQFDTSQVTCMREMFYNCKNLRELNLSNFDMSKVTDDEDMFENCPAKVTGL